MKLSVNAPKSLIGKEEKGNAGLAGLENIKPLILFMFLKRLNRS